MFLLRTLFIVSVEKPEFLYPLAYVILFFKYSRFIVSPGGIIKIINPFYPAAPFTLLIHVPDHPLYRQGKVPATFIKLLTAVLYDLPLFRLKRAVVMYTGIQAFPAFFVVSVTLHSHLLVHVVSLINQLQISL